jgi:hypothetical protein
VRISRWAMPGGCWVWRWCIGSPLRSVSADWRCWGSSATCVWQGRFYQFSLAVDVYTARERARCGDRDDAIHQLRAAVDDLFDAKYHSYGLLGIPATRFLVETLLDRGSDDDMAEAEAAIERLAAAPADEGLVIREIWLLRLRALLARAHGDAEA